MIYKRFSSLIDEYNYELEHKRAWEEFWIRFPYYDTDKIPEFYWPSDLFDLQTGCVLDEEHKDYVLQIIGSKTLN